MFWIGLYVFVNLASVMYLGGLALQTILGIDMLTGVIGLAAFAAAYSLYGGLSAVAWTDIIQVVVLLIGGLITSYLALNTVSGGAGFIEGLTAIYHAVPEKFDMILERSNPEYMNLPGIGVLIGGMPELQLWQLQHYFNSRCKVMAHAVAQYLCLKVLKVEAKPCDAELGSPGLACHLSKIRLGTRWYRLNNCSLVHSQCSIAPDRIPWSWNVLDGQFNILYCQRTRSSCRPSRR